MAIFVPGMKCPLCNNPITREQARRLFPPFVKNSLDPLCLFHDATVHEDCLLRDPRRDALEAVMALRARARRLPKTCIVCHEPIGHTKDCFSTEYLTSDPSNALYAYNYINIHRDHLEQWDRWDEFARLATLLQASDAWNGARILPSD